MDCLRGVFVDSVASSEYVIVAVYECTVGHRGLLRGLPGSIFLLNIITLLGNIQAHIIWLFSAHLPLYASIKLIFFSSSQKLAFYLQNMVSCRHSAIFLIRTASAVHLGYFKYRLRNSRRKLYTGDSGT